MNKRYLCVAFMLAVIMFLTSCAPEQAAKACYARYIPDEKEVIELAVSIKDAPITKVYFSIFDYVKQGATIAQFDMVQVESVLNELRENEKKYQQTIELNEADLEITKLSIEYNQLKLDELKEKYGQNLSETEKLELDILQLQINMYEQTQERDKSERLYNTSKREYYAAEIEKYAALREYFTMPVSGYLLTLTTKPDLSNERFDIGTIIPTQHVLLMVETDSAIFDLNQDVRVKLHDEWIPMWVFDIDAHAVYLKFHDKSPEKYINFQSPIRVEVLSD